MTVIELLDNLIMDLTDYIEDYKGEVRSGRCSNLEEYNYRIRADELIKWRETLRIIRSEQFD